MFIRVEAPEGTCPEVKVDGRTAIPAGSTRREAFREVKAGAHAISAKGATGGRIVVRQIAEILNYPPCANSSVNTNPSYGWEFFSKHVMPNSTTQCGGGIPSAHFAEFKAQGGLSAMAERNAKKAKLLYDAIDGSNGFYKGHAAKDSRSFMNVTFRLPSEELEKKFVDEAKAKSLCGVKGHRSVGGMRASIYNAMPYEGVERLAEFMEAFRKSKYTGKGFDKNGKWGLTPEGRIHIQDHSDSTVSYRNIKIKEL